MFDAIKNTFSIKGRAKRSEFNYFMCLLLVFTIIISSPFAQYSENLFFILLIISLFLTVSHITVSIRRLHDLGRTGWFVLLFFIPLINLIFAFYLMIIKGSDKKNKYDENFLNKEIIKSKVQNDNSLFKRIYKIYDKFVEDMFGMGSKASNSNDNQFKNNSMKEDDLKGPWNKK